MKGIADLLNTHTHKAPDMTDKSLATPQAGQKSKGNSEKSEVRRPPRREPLAWPPRLLVPLVNLFPLGSKSTLPCPACDTGTPLPRQPAGCSAPSAEGASGGRRFFLVPGMLLPGLSLTALNGQQQQEPLAMFTPSQMQWYEPCRQLPRVPRSSSHPRAASPGPTEGSSQHITLTC